MVHRVFFIALKCFSSFFFFVVVVCFACQYTFLGRSLARMDMCHMPLKGGAP
uniref:Uncharacterized protein n=1 Tax=Anguilla anguilla TaxID=7936 RepID=A0A0E9U866_ANGAN